MRCPPPNNFRPARNVRTAELADRPDFVKPARSHGAKADGRRYERKALKYLEEVFPERIVPSPWFVFTTEYSGCVELFCQPDALVFDPRQGIITVVEVKLRHTSNAWWQLKELYIPVVRAVFGSAWEYRPIEVVKSFDPHTKFPEKFELIRDVRDIELPNVTSFHVHIWDGKRNHAGRSSNATGRASLY